MDRTPGPSEARLRAVDFDPFAQPFTAVPATPAQREVWLSAQLSAEANCAYNQALRIRLEGALDVAALRRSVQQVVDRHEALRGTFSPDGTQFLIGEQTSIPVEVVELPASAPLREEARQAAYLREVNTPFDLVRGPLLRATLLRLTASRHELLLTVHHIVGDGWSTGILFRDLAACYRAATGGTAVSASPPDKFSDYAHEIEAPERSPARAKAQQYWREQFAAVPPVLDLPTDHARPPLRSFGAAQVTHDLPQALVLRLKAMMGATHTTLFTMLLAGFETLLFRLGGIEDLVVGVPAAGQPHLGRPNLVGHCVNLLPIRVRLDGATPFTAFVKSLQGTVLDAYEHQAFTFGSLLDAIDVPRDASRIPLVPVVFNVDADASPIDLGGLVATCDALPRTAENFEVFLNAVVTTDGVRLECTFNHDLFTAETIHRRLASLEALLQHAVEAPDTPLNQLTVLGTAERDLLLGAWNDTDSPHEPTALHRLFERQANATPDALAVVDDSTRLTYADLDARANGVAALLRQHGVTREHLVAIALDRSVDLIAAILGVLKAGGAYLPLDPAYPAARLQFMVGDSGARIVLTSAAHQVPLPNAGQEVTQLHVEDAVPASGAEASDAAGADSLAYVIYTSGSTGKPKGVAIEHRNASALLHWARSVFPPEECRGTLFSTSICFDLSVFEIFLPLSSGGAIIVVNDLPSLPRTPARDEVTLINTVPSAISELLQAGGVPSSVRVINLAGEPLTTALVDALYARTGAQKVYDLYGPTEDTTYSTWVLRAPKARATIGRPILNTQAYVLDARRQPVPIGVRGELYLGGAGVARGYLDRPELTAERFLPDPFGSRGGRLYRTGDVVRYLSDGQIEFLGRADHQVKVRGFRIELGEIEATLQAHPAITEAVVVVHGAGTKDARLVAYVVFGDGAYLTVSEVRQHLRGVLPAHAIPGVVVELEDLPRTPNGKVDRRALPDPLDGEGVPPVAFTPPATPSEELIATVWKTMLPAERIGRYDNFFELGGHSLLSLRAVAAIEKRTGVRMDPRLFFFQSLEQLGMALDADTASGE